MGRKKKIPDCSILQLKNLLRVLGLLKGKSEVPIMPYSSHEIWLLHHLLDLIANNSSHSTSVLPPLTYLLCMECARHSVIPGVCTMYFPSLGNTLQRLLLNFSSKSSMRLTWTPMQICKQCHLPSLKPLFSCLFFHCTPSDMS